MSQDMQLKWKVTAMDCYPEFSGATDYVFNVHWDCLSYYNGVSGGPFYGRVYSVTSVPASPGPFIPYADLKEEQVLDWVYGVMPSGDKERYENSSMQQILNKITPPVVTPPNPWPTDVFPIIAPSISSQPQTGITCWSGQNVSIQAGVNGQPLSLQWQKDGVNISGANFSSYVLNDAQVSDAGTYVLTAANSLGSVASSGCVLAVNPPQAPVITSQPSGLSVKVGEFALLSVAFDAYPAPVCVWSKDGADVGLGNNYAIQSASLQNSGTYKVTISNSYGTVESSPAVVEVTE